MKQWVRNAHGDQSVRFACEKRVSRFDFRGGRDSCVGSPACALASSPNGYRRSSTSTTSGFSITHIGGTGTTMACRRSTMNNGILRSCQLSRKLGACQNRRHRFPQQSAKRSSSRQFQRRGSVRPFSCLRESLPEKHPRHAAEVSRLQLDSHRVSYRNHFLPGKRVPITHEKRNDMLADRLDCQRDHGILRTHFSQPEVHLSKDYQVGELKDKGTDCAV